MEEGLVTEVAVTGMTVSQYVIFGFSFLFVLYSMGTFLTSRKQEFGLLVLHGLTKRKLRKLLFFESCLIGFGAILIGVVMGLAFEKLFLMAVSRVILFNEMSFYMPWKALGLTVSAFILLFISISYFTSLIVRTSKVGDLLKGTSKPESFPVSSKLLSLLAIILIGAGYFLAMTAKEDQVVIRFLPVVCLVIVGTYFLFTQLSVYVLKSMQRKPEHNWIGNKLISRSNLIFRLKDNARVFFLVSIISTIAICATGTISTVGAWGERDFETPLAMTYIAFDQGDALRMEQRLSNELEQENIDHQSVDISLKEVMGVYRNPEFEDSYENDYTILSQSEFNQLARLLDIPELDLEDQQIQPIATYENAWVQNDDSDKEESVTFTSLNEPFEMLPMFPHRVFSSSYNLNINPIVVTDEVFEDISPYNERFMVGYHIPNWEETGLIGSDLFEEQEKKQLSYYQDPTNPSPTFNFHSSGLEYLRTISLYQTMLLMGSVIGVVFFIATGSFLYYRLHNYLPQDAERFLILRKLGLTYKKINRIVTTEMSLLFFVPFTLSLVHSGVAFVALQSMFVQETRIFNSVITVIGGYVVAQIIYFLLMRKQYLIGLRRLIEKS